MNIKRAWAALWREPEPVIVEKPVEVVREVENATKEQVETLVGDRLVDVYIAKSRAYARSMDTYRAMRGFVISEPAVKPVWEGCAYLTCAQAFAEHGADADVTTAKGFIAGKHVYVLSEMAKHPLAPKPKVAKGRAK